MQPWLRVDASEKLKSLRKPVCAAGNRRLSAAVKKLVASQSATACSVQGVPNLIQIQDQITGRRFLVGLGASLSLLLHKSKNPCSGPPLVSASGLPIWSWGFQWHTVKFGPHAFTFNFLLAYMARPILGFDFLCAHRLNVSPSTGTLHFAAGSRPGEPPLTVAATIPAALGQVSSEIFQKIPQIFKSC